MKLLCFGRSRWTDKTAGIHLFHEIAPIHDWRRRHRSWLGRSENEQWWSGTISVPYFFSSSSVIFLLFFYLRTQQHLCTATKQRRNGCIFSLLVAFLVVIVLLLRPVDWVVPYTHSISEPPPFISDDRNAILVHQSAFPFIDLTRTVSLSLQPPKSVRWWWRGGGDDALWICERRIGFKRWRGDTPFSAARTHEESESRGETSQEKSQSITLPFGESWRRRRRQVSSLLFGFFSPRRTTKLVKNKKIFFPFHLSLSLSTGSSPSWPRRKGPGERINVCLHVYGPMAIPWLDSLPFPRPASVSLFIAFKLSMSSCHLPLFSFCALAPSFYGHLDERGERERERSYESTPDWISSQAPCTFFFFYFFFFPFVFYFILF